MLMNSYQKALLELLRQTGPLPYGDVRRILHHIFLVRGRRPKNSAPMIQQLLDTGKVFLLGDRFLALERTQTPDRFMLDAVEVMLQIAPERISGFSASQPPFLLAFSRPKDDMEHRYGILRLTEREFLPPPHVLRQIDTAVLLSDRLEHRAVPEGYPEIIYAVRQGEGWKFYKEESSS